MDNTTIPPFEAVPFASGATTGKRNAVPVTTSTPGAASYTVGFPPETFQPIASGGIPPSGADFNGVLYDLSKAMRWEQAGGQYPFNATFATAIGGYPKGAIVLRSDSKGQWLSTTDNNSTDPDSGSASGWIALRANTGSATVAAVAGANVPTPTQLGAQLLLVTGTLASNATLTLPLIAGSQWTVVNNTTGAGTLTVQGASGSGVQVTQGTGIFAYTDGTNYYAISAPVSGAYLPINGTAVAATKLATARAFNLTGVITASAQSFDGTANVTFTTAIADGALSVAKTSGLQSALDAKANLSGASFTGAISVAGTITAAASFVSSTAFWVGATANGSGAMLFRPNGPASTTNQMELDPTGILTVAAATYATGFQISSDRRLKTNIHPRDVQRGLALLLARMFCEWDWKATGAHECGLIAQRVKRFAARYVTTNPVTRKLAIDKAGIALEASMDCALQLDEQAKTIKALMRRVAQLEKQA